MGQAFSGHGPIGYNNTPARRSPSEDDPSNNLNDAVLLYRPRIDENLAIRCRPSIRHPPDIPPSGTSCCTGRPDNMLETVLHRRRHKQWVTLVEELPSCLHPEQEGPRLSVA